MTNMTCESKAPKQMGVVNSILLNAMLLTDG